MKWELEDKQLGKSYCCIDPGTGTAIIGASVIGAGGSIFSGLMGGSASKAQANAIRYAAELEDRRAREFERQYRADAAPYRSLGETGSNLYQQMLTGGPEATAKIQASPLYQWQLEMGQRALDRQLSQRGLFNSGAGLELNRQFQAQLLGEETSRQMGYIKDATVIGESAVARTGANVAAVQGANMGAQADLARSLGSAIQQQGISYGNIGMNIGNQAIGLANNYAGYQLSKPLYERLFGTSQGITGQSSAVEMTMPNYAQSSAQYGGIDTSLFTGADD